MEANKLSQIEKKMEMSLDDLIKLNRKGSSKKPGGKGKAAGGATGGKGAGQKTAPKNPTAKPGIAGKRQAIQQKKAAKATAATPAGGKGIRVNRLGLKQTPRRGVMAGVSKGGKKTAGQLKQTMAQKILNKARGKPAVATNMLARKQGAAKQLMQKKRGPSQAVSKQGGTSLALSKSLDQMMKERRQQQQQAVKQRKGPRKQSQQQQQQQRQVQRPVVGKQQRGKQVRAQQGGRQQQLHATQRGGVQKRGGRGGGMVMQQQPSRRAPVEYQQARTVPARRQMQVPARRQQQQQQQQQQHFQRQPPRQVISSRPPPMRMPPRRMAVQYADANPYSPQVFGGYSAPPQQEYAQIDPMTQRQALAALRLKHLEEEVHKAERRAAIHRQQELNAFKPRAAAAAGQLGGEQPARAQGSLAHGGMGGPSVGMGARAGAAAPRGFAAARGGYGMGDGYGY